VGEIRGLWDMISCSLFARMASSKCRWERWEMLYNSICRLHGQSSYSLST
jgi:hypothetical protein